MNEPCRLREQTESRLERALLDAGRSYRSSAETRKKTLMALGLAGSTALSAGVVSTSLFAKVGWPKLVAAISAVGAVAAIPVGYYVWQEQHGTSPGPAATATTATVDTATPAALVRTNAEEPATDPSVAQVVEDPVPPRPSPTQVRARPAMVPVQGGGEPARSMRADAGTEGPGVALTAELAALDAARSALGRGEPARALVLLDDYARAYPHGRLELEAEVLRIDALARSGQADVARQRAEAFLLQHPNSVLASRVRGYLNR